MTQPEFDIVDAIAKCRKGPNGEPVHPKWAMSAESWEADLNTVPLFMQEIPSSTDSNPELAALQSLLYDGDPSEVAENFKTQGNLAFREGPSQYRHAIEFYSQGIQVSCPDTSLNAVLYCNRAAVHLELGNVRSCINDCAEAVKLNPGFVRAYYRMGRAYALLEAWDDAVSAYSSALLLDSSNGPIQIAMESVKTKRALELKSTHEKAHLLEVQAKNDLCVAQELERLGIQSATLSIPQVDVSDYSSHKPVWDPDTCTLSLPCLVLYPEFNQSDFITQFDVDTTFMDQLIPILDQAPAPWDPNHTYTTSSVNIYFLTFDIDPNKRRLTKVGKKLTLQTVLKSSWARLVNGVVEFLVLHRSNQFSLDYVEKYRSCAKQ